MLSTVIGHEQLKEKLIIRLNGDPAGVYLFNGPPSIGKRTTAFEASKVILCMKSGERCSCPSCTRFRMAEHPDFLCIGQHERIKVADVSAVIEFSSTAPLVSDYKTVVIDNVDEITREAANRLLKILEEPPLKFSFFLVTSNPKKIIPTILSRCIKYTFGGLSSEEYSTVINKKLGFSPKKSEVLGLLAAGASLDVFKNAGLYLKFRKMAVDFLSNVKRLPLIDSIDFVDNIDSKDIPAYTDIFVLLLTDFILLKNKIPKITNKDIYDDLVKISDTLNEKALLGVVGLFSQIKRYTFLNINLSLYLKNAIIKSYPFFMADA